VFTYEEILVHPARDEWILAAVNEITQLESKGTWVEVDASQAMSKIIPGTWTFKLKRRPDGTVKKYKAHYCVRGDLQEGTDVTYAPVVSFRSVRIFLVIKLLIQWETCTVDFDNAFVQATLDTPVWIHPPRGFRSTTNERKICLQLKKSLYGLRTAPKLWNYHIVAALRDLQFTQSSFDPCIFYRKNVLVILYIDDLGLAFPNQNVLDELLTEFRSAYERRNFFQIFENFLRI
jgi:hypothetical protein